MEFYTILKFFLAAESLCVTDFVKQLSIKPHKFWLVDKRRPNEGFCYQDHIEGISYAEDEIYNLLHRVSNIRAEAEHAGVIFEAIELSLVPYIAEHINPGIHISTKSLNLLMDIGQGLEVTIDIDMYALTSGEMVNES